MGRCEHDVPVFRERALFALWRALRELRRFARTQQRPEISEAAARERYEPLAEAVARALAAEFGTEVHREDDQPARRRRRVFVSATWVLDRPLSAFPDWAPRLHAVLKRIVDVVHPQWPPEGWGDAPAGVPPEMVRELRARGFPGDLGDPDGEVVADSVTSAYLMSTADRLGGHVVVETDDDRTCISARARINRAPDGSPLPSAGSDPRRPDVDGVVDVQRGGEAGPVQLLSIGGGVIGLAPLPLIVRLPRRR